MAATPKATLGSHADKWIIIGRPQEYSAHYICYPPPGARGLGRRHCGGVVSTDSVVARYNINMTSFSSVLLGAMGLLQNVA